MWEGIVSKIPPISIRTLTGDACGEENTANMLGWLPSAGYSETIKCLVILCTQQNLNPGVGVWPGGTGGVT